VVGVWVSCREDFVAGDCGGELEECEDTNPMDDGADLLAAQAYYAASWPKLNGNSNAALNPLAVYRDPITMADYMTARPEYGTCLA
jgi:hypothetical protein